MSDAEGWEVLLDRYVAGECSAAEEMEVVRRLGEADELRLAETLRAARARVSARMEPLPASTVPLDEVRGALARVAPRLVKPEVARRMSHPGSRVGGPRWWTVAGSASLGAFAVAFLVWLGRSSMVSGNGSAFREFATPAGSRATVTLRDGTRVVLGPESRMRVPSNFGRDTRTVVLDGEAYFSVVHDGTHPFLVHAQRATVRDVGTEFDVQAYASDTAVRIAVAQGEVCLDTAATSTCDRSRAPFLQAGDMATVSSGRVMVARHVDVTAMTAWVQGRLVFSNTRLSEVARELSRVFGLSVTVADSALAAEHFTGVYDQESVEQVLDDIMRSAGARYERTGRTVVIRRGLAGHLRGQPQLPQPLTTVEASIHAHQ